MESHCRDDPTVSLETELPIDCGPEKRWGPLRRKHIWSVFDGADENCDDDRLSTYIYSDVMEVAIGWVIHDKINYGPNKGWPSALIGTTDLFHTTRYAEMASNLPVGGPTYVAGETRRMQTLRLLIKYGSGISVEADSFEQLQQYIRTNFCRVLLPHNLGNNHYIVFDICFEGKGAPYVKVWDSLDSWRGRDPNTIPQILYLLTLFFEEGDVIDVYVNRNRDEPNQGDTSGCAAFAFFTLVHLALGCKPPAAREGDEAFLRNYMWGYVVSQKCMDLPRLANPQQE